MIRTTHLMLALLIIASLVVACAPPEALVTAPPEPTTAPEAAAQAPVGRGPRAGFGPGSGMMARHHAVIPGDYAEQSNPVVADEESLARGQELYVANCASCHGETGMGEGPAGQALDPPVAPIAHTSRMLSDDYLFWRISEGGIPFGTAMPAWKDALDEQARWDLVNYVRTLDTTPAQGLGGRGRGPAAGMGEGDHRAEMLAEAVALEVISQEEADLFEQVHQVLDEVYFVDQADMESMEPRGMMTMQRALTDQAVRDGRITQEEADRFTEIHDRLLAAGVMQ